MYGPSSPRHCIDTHRPASTVRVAAFALQCAFVFEAQPFGNPPASFVLVVCPTPDSPRPDMPEGELRNAARRLGCEALTLKALPAPPTDLEYAGSQLNLCRPQFSTCSPLSRRNPNIGKSARSSQFAAPRRANSSVFSTGWSSIAQIIEAGKRRISSSVSSNDLLTTTPSPGRGARISRRSVSK